MPDRSKYRMDYAPASYWIRSDPLARLLGRVKGDARRKGIEQRIKSGRDLPAWLTASALQEETRSLIGRVHLRFMGGEYLPDLAKTEVEIARVSLKSVTSDVISIRARADGPCIRYAIRDEYEDEGGEPRYKCVPEVLNRPLTMGELVHLIDNACPGGIGGSARDYNAQETGRPETYVDFATVSSVFYPELQRYYEEEAEEWLAAIQAARRRAAEEAEREALAECARQQALEAEARAAGPRGPLDFPADRTLHDLTLVERAALQRWLHDVVGLSEARLQKRPPRTPGATMARAEHLWTELRWSDGGVQNVREFPPTDRRPLREALAEFLAGRS